jgi:hypothetical protein
VSASTLLILDPDELVPQALCLRCEGPLDRHQPDVQQPDRVLGTCPTCGAWYLLHCEKIDVATLWRDWPYGS